MDPPGLVTFTTDFGAGHYVAQMRGVVHRICPDARLLDVTHDVTPGNVKEGAFLLWAAVPFLPRAVHVGVVDPGVGTDRSAILVTTRSGALVGPDNGLLIPAARRLGLLEVVEATNEELFLPEVSATFHGRDVFSPVAAYVARGVQPDEVGTLADGFIEEALQTPVVDGKADAEVLHVDRFGDCVTSIWGEDLDEHVAVGGTVPVTVAGKEEELLRIRTFADAAAEAVEGAALLVGSSGFVELVVNGGSAAELYGLKAGSRTVFHLE